MIKNCSEEKGFSKGLNRTVLNIPNEIIGNDQTLVGKDLKAIKHSQ